MNKLHLLIILISACFFGLIGCQVEEPDHGIVISGVPESMTMRVNESTGKLNIDVESRDGLASFKISVNGIEQLSQTFSGRTSYSTTFEYFPSLREVGEPVMLGFEAVDRDGDVVNAQTILTVLDMANTTRVSSDITADQTWETGRIYILTKKVSVLPGATLTIQKGVIVKADFKKEGELPSLVILRGAKIYAEGTPNQPIIFTSVLDQISDGWISSGISNHVKVWTSADWYAGWDKYYEDLNALWGGLVILGNAKGSFPSNNSEAILEENPYSDTEWRYGGTEDADNSGVLKYISIRYAGNPGDGKKPISPLTLGAVGYGTTIENLEIYTSYYSDGIRILGGKVELKNLFIDRVNGHGVLIDQGWSGVLDNFYIGNSENGIYFGGPKGNFYNGNHLIKNGELASNKSYLKFEESANSDLEGILFNIEEFYGPMESFPPTGINLVPTQFNSRVSKLEALAYQHFTDAQFFNEWSDEVKWLTYYESKSVGSDWTPFRDWSFGYYKKLNPY